MEKRFDDLKGLYEYLKPLTYSNVEKIIKALQDHPGCSETELAAWANLKVFSAKNAVAHLKYAGLVRMVDVRAGTRWKKTYYLNLERYFFLLDIGKKIEQIDEIFLPLFDND